MTNEELLQELSQKIQSGEITKEQVDSFFDNSQSPKVTFWQRFSITKVLYVLGVSVAVLGVIVFVSQIWEDIGTLSRIAITLGLGIITTMSGSQLHTLKPKQVIGSVFHVIGGILIPAGAIVTLMEFSTNVTSALPVAITFLVISIFYLFLTLRYKTAVLTFFTIANATTFIYYFIQMMTTDTYLFDNDLYLYTTMVLGISYIFLAQSFRNNWNSQLCGILQFFGISAFLGSAFIFVDESVLWQLGYFLLIPIGFYFSIVQKSKSILVISTIFLIIHIAFITGKYFANSVGWPISLIFLGFIFIGLGYTSISINKKYIANTNTNTKVE